jgi:hypothetical protein
VDFDVDEEDYQLDASTSSLELGPELKALTDAVRDLTAGINIYYIHDIKGLIDTGVTVLPDNLIFIQDGHSLSTETLTAHEIGHVLGLDDVNDETRLMHFEGSAAGNNCFLNKPEWDTSNATAERF